ncbi:histidine phosphatase family protein [Odoribacter lunatus]|uniref:histidine phosphatase family protein n=1 Tax=Odoribacter lunatus TaxID=2941335 RepID=UPI00203AEEFA|nr:histidine phosphatase family protein [Odoribacter lunatus]
MAHTELLLTRHGETLENKQDIMQGHIPGTLSPAGIRQAEELGKLLEPQRIDAIVSSDLARSLDTARIIGKLKQLTPRPTPLLREIDWGPHTGGKLSSINWKQLPEGCETLENLFQRAQTFIQWVKQEYSGQRILAIGHGAIDRAIIAFCEGKSAPEMADMPIMKNTSFVTLNL